MTRHPSAKAVPLDDIVNIYGATFFRDALTRFVVRLNQPTLTSAQVELAAGAVYLNFRKLPVYHKIKFMLKDVQGLGTSSAITQDIAHVRPPRKGKYDANVAARFDTVLVRPGPGATAQDRGVMCGTSYSLNVLSNTLISCVSPSSL